MELTLKQHGKDQYPVCGFFVEGDDLTVWIEAVDRMDLDPTEIKVYGLPSRRANVVWGCLVTTAAELTTDRLGPLATAHRAASRLIVPAKCRVVPELTQYDLEQLFGEDVFVLHPEFGLYKLTGPLDLSDSLLVTDVPIVNSLRPADYHVSSGEVLAFTVASSPREDIELKLAVEVRREKLENTPLSLTEKLRLKLYQAFMPAAEGSTDRSVREDKLQRLAARLGMSGVDAYARMLEDFENLQERNKKEIDKLLGLLQNDPEAALRFAIPLDEHGYSRGEEGGRFTMQDRGLNFSLFGNLGSGGSGSVNLGDEFYRLRAQYIAAAQELEKNGKYEKAAYIYLKLLKDYDSAAETLHKGDHFEKAAVVYLRYAKNEQAAAECYAAGKIYDEAITLYTKLEQWEKVGDLNVLRGEDESARSAYRLQLETEIDKKAFVKAAKLSKEKLHDLAAAQALLLRGWDEDADAYNCLQYYLANITDAKIAWREIENIRKHRLNGSNDAVFLKILSREYKKAGENQEAVKNMAYDLLSELLAAGKISAHRVLDFNEKDSRLRADALRYELKKKRR